MKFKCSSPSRNLQFSTSAHFKIFFKGKSKNRNRTFCPRSESDKGTKDRKRQLEVEARERRRGSRRKVTRRDPWEKKATEAAKVGHFKKEKKLGRIGRKGKGPKRFKKRFPTWNPRASGPPKNPPPISRLSPEFLELCAKSLKTLLFLRENEKSFPIHWRDGGLLNGSKNWMIRKRSAKRLKTFQLV